MDSFLFWKMMTSHDYQGFNIILEEEAKKEMRSTIIIYDQLLKCTWAIHVLHVVNINT